MISFVIASLGRATLARTLASIETWPGDEILVIGSMGAASDPRVRFVPRAPGRDWGHTERNESAALVTQPYVSHMDDDDRYAPGHRALMADAIATTPDRPVFFKMRYPADAKGHHGELWQDPVLRYANVGTPMALLPNQREKFGIWAPKVGGDFEFFRSWKWRADEIVWRPEVIALLRH